MSLLDFVCSSTRTGHPRFFLGSDSAPHPPHTKSTSTPTQGCAAGIYTSPILLPLVTHLLESFGALDRLDGFASTFGRKFYGREILPSNGREVVLRKVGPEKSKKVEERYVMGEDSVVPFWAGKSIAWEIVE